MESGNTKRVVRLAKEEDFQEIKILLNSKGIREWLGGTVHDSYIKDGQISVYEVDGEIIGASQYSLETSHRMKMDWVGVRGDHRREGIASSLYYGWWLVAGYLGMLVIEDNLVSNNIVMPLFLSQLGFVNVVTQRSKVKRHHNLVIYVKDMVSSDSYWSSRIAVPVRFERKRLFPSFFDENHEKVKGFCSEEQAQRFKDNFVRSVNTFLKSELEEKSETVSRRT